MALAIQLPRSLIARLLTGRATRPAQFRPAETLPPFPGYCCRCRLSLGLSYRAAPGAGWARAAAAPRLSRRRPLLSPAQRSPAAAAAALVLPGPGPGPCPSPPERSYSSTEEPQPPPRQQTRVMYLGLFNPLVWLRTQVYSFLIWAYFDQEFSIAEFTEGAKQAFAHVSKLLSQCKFDLLEELVTKEVLQVLKEKVASLPDNYKTALAAEFDEIVYTATGRKFVHILMCFWYLTSAKLPDETLSGTKIFQLQLGDQNVETKQLLSANYEFQREFTQGVKPDWTIARVEHSKLLE
ncbi:m-AAA protease-interacting protein 1, mitochondrial isoform X2 [Phascolarctos cinereus]|uniref:M-AAA protease-interacting protein 1, mitochondrial isoform X2 n=1 Tax=Phascolarctos cinereus TaxID=38626 RepID=A0A6P5K6M2_PHACI|nr:m-AAA protease-interacting protein 1, mitochondrial isoform X2 [Phascolarctos cinereus]